jgi:hypothetical protein
MSYESNRWTANRVAVLLTLLAAISLSWACGGSSGASSGSTGGSTDSLALTLSGTTATAPAGGSIARVTATVARTNSSGSVTLSVSGLPTGASVTYDAQPGTGNSGTIALNPGSASAGTYALTVSATDGTATASTGLSFAINAGIASQLATPITWSSTAPLMSAISDSTHNLVAIKDPSVVYYNGNWHVFATTADTSGSWNMAYYSFADWSQAPAAKPYYMDATAGLSGYHCAPEVFFFAPQSKWYLIYQSGPPQYSTTADIDDPSSWTAPQSFFASQPSTVANWLDFWTICDTTNCYLFFSGDDGNFYRSQTTVSAFPADFSTPVAIMKSSNAADLFEASNVYKLKGLNQYLTLIEAAGSTGHRYFRAFISSSLDGDLTPLPEANSWATPFAGINNVTFDSGTTWTDDISHGEMLRDGYDQTLEIDPSNLQYLYQGVDPNNTASSYSQIPWQLGILTRSN